MSAGEAGVATPPVVIVGGGIMGCATAYYLAKRGVPCLVLERVGLASGASGKAGGFLARDWCDDAGPLGRLARESYRLHAELETELNSPIDYRTLETLSLRLRPLPGGQRCARPITGCPDWITAEVTRASRLGDRGSTAQVHPYKLTLALADAAKRLVGSEFRLRGVAGVEVSPAEAASSAGQRRVTSLRLDGDSGQVVPCAGSSVVFTMGPWTSTALGDWLGLADGAAAVFGHRAHSVVLAASGGGGGSCVLSPQALYTEQEGGDSPEMYPRPDGTVYVCGLSDDTPLPASTAEVVADAAKLRRLAQFAESVSDRLSADSVVSGQACYLPVSRTGLPLIGRLPGMANAYVAAGHSCWGILNGPATGLMLAQLILDGACSFMDAEPFAARVGDRGNPDGL